MRLRKLRHKSSLRTLDQYPDFCLAQESIGLALVLPAMLMRAQLEAIPRVPPMAFGTQAGPRHPKPHPSQSLHIVPLFRIRVTATYGPVMPRLSDLSGEPLAGYKRLSEFVHNGRPRGWFLDKYSEFSPPLLILGTFYEIEAATEWVALTQARARFAAELESHKLPPPPQAMDSELADWA